MGCVKQKTKKCEQKLAVIVEEGLRESVQQGNYEGLIVFNPLVQSFSRLNRLTGVKVIEIINQWELLVPF